MGSDPNKLGAPDITSIPDDDPGQEDNMYMAATMNQFDSPCMVSKHQQTLSGSLVDVRDISHQYAYINKGTSIHCSVQLDAHILML